MTFPVEYKAPAGASKATATIVSWYSAMGATVIRKREGEAASWQEILAESSRAAACRTFYETPYETPCDLGPSGS